MGDKNMKFLHVAAVLVAFTLMAATTAEDPQVSDPSHAVQRQAQGAQDVDELHVLGAFFNPSGQQNSPEEVEYQRPAAKTGEKLSTAFVAAQNRFRHRRNMGARRPGYVKRCVVTASMHRKWASAHQRWLRARKAWAAAKRRFRFEKSKHRTRRVRRSHKKRRTRRSWHRKSRKMSRQKLSASRERALKFKKARLRMKHKERASKLRKEILRNVRARRAASRKARYHSTERASKKRRWATRTMQTRKRMNERRIKHVRRYRAKRERAHKFRLARLRMRHKRARYRSYRKYRRSRARSERAHKFRVARVRMKARERRLKFLRSRRMSLVQLPPKTRMIRRARIARARARRARRYGHRGRGARRGLVRRHMKFALRAREKARKARHMRHWRKFHGKQRKKLIRADNKARRLRHAAREARQNNGKNNPNEMFNKMRYAREVARKARMGLTRERSRKRLGRIRRGKNGCLKWIWWPHSETARKDWFKTKKYTSAVNAARNAWRAAHGFNASTPNVEGRKTKPDARGKEIWKANRGFISMTHARNVLNLKAYCVASHGKLVVARKGNSQLSSLGTFLYRFGVKKKTRNAFGEYTALMKTYSRFYTRGLGLYMLRMMKSAMRRNGGVLVWSSRKTMILLNHSRLGLRGQPKAFRKWGVRKNQFTGAVKQVRRLNSPLWKAVKNRAGFKKSLCKCQGTSKWPKYKTCRKHFKYDKQPWCQVAKMCPGASHSRQGFKWRYC